MTEAAPFFRVKEITIEAGFIEVLVQQDLSRAVLPDLGSPLMITLSCRMISGSTSTGSIIFPSLSP